MSDSGTIKFGGWALALSAVFYILTFIFEGLPYGASGLVATSLMVPATWGLYHHYSQHDRTYRVRLAVMALLVGALFITGLYLSALVGGLLERGEPVEAAALEGIVQPLGQAVASVSIMFGNIIFIGTFLLGLSSVRTGGDPAWLGWLCMAGSAITAPWFAFAFAPAILQIIPAAGFALVIVWMVVTGTRLARTPG